MRRSDPSSLSMPTMQCQALAFIAHPTPNMGFCSRCGERLHDERRCDCGGDSVSELDCLRDCGDTTQISKLKRSSSSAPRSIKILRSRTTTPNEDADPWRRQYVSRSSRPSSSTSNRNRHVDDNDDHVDDDDRGDAGGTDGSTGLLQAPAKLTQSTLSANGRHNQHPPRPAIPRTVSQQSIEEITRSFGSVLDPEHQRKRWSCSSCATQFIRVCLRALFAETAVG